MLNTNRRLKSIYGNRAGLKINATDEGYAVSFVIPERWIESTDDRLIIMEKNLN
jgi:sensor histidine kinase YesM